MTIKKSSTSKKKVKKEISKNQDFQTPKKGEFFIVKKNGIEGKVLKVTTSGEITVFIGGEEKVILNLNLWKQIDQEKGYYKESIKNGDEIEFDKTIEKLTIKQELFCQNYIKNDALRGNGTLAYDEAYGMMLDEKDRTGKTDELGREICGTSEYDKIYNLCSASSSRLLRLVKIQERNVELLNELLNEKKVDSRLAQIIFRGKDTDSLNAIKVFNDLKQRIMGRETNVDIQDGDKKISVKVKLPE